MRDIRDYTVAELIELGAKVEVALFRDNKVIAKQFLDSFGGLNEVEETLINKGLGGYYEATESSKNLISVIVFYDK